MKARKDLQLSVTPESILRYNAMCHDIETRATDGNSNIGVRVNIWGEVLNKQS